MSTGTALEQLHLTFPDGVLHLNDGWQSLVDELRAVAKTSGAEGIVDPLGRRLAAPGWIDVHLVGRVGLEHGPTSEETAHPMHRMLPLNPPEVARLATEEQASSSTGTKRRGRLTHTRWPPATRCTVAPGIASAIAS